MVPGGPGSGRVRTRSHPGPPRYLSSAPRVAPPLLDARPSRASEGQVSDQLTRRSNHHPSPLKLGLDRGPNTRSWITKSRGHWKTRSLMSSSMSLRQELGTPEANLLPRRGFSLLSGSTAVGRSPLRHLEDEWTWPSTASRRPVGHTRPCSASSLNGGGAESHQVGSRGARDATCATSRSVTPTFTIREKPHGPGLPRGGVWSDGVLP